MPDRPICDYEGSDYQSSFWDKGGREYEDRAEAIALKRLLPQSGGMLLEIGAGAGRNTARYKTFQRIVLLDFSSTQLAQAQARLGLSEKYVYVAADAYHLPFIGDMFDAATMIRVLHHMADAPKALEEAARVLMGEGIFILEYANKRNLKSILRYALGRQYWNPCTREPVEFAALNFDFHPAAVRGWLESLHLRIERTLAVSHFRAGFLKRAIHASVLVFLDSILQWTGALWQLTPSVFVRARKAAGKPRSRPLGMNPISFFRCPACEHSPLTEGTSRLDCPNCGRQWGISNGMFDFRKPLAIDAGASEKGT
jgi:SAM-dependent methyltransferase